MPFVAIIIGAILIIAAFNNTHTQLAANLEKDIPGFFKWGIAIAAILGIGYIPGLRTPTRWLLGLVALVVLLTQYKNIIQGFQNFAQTGTQTATAAATSEQQAAATSQAQATASESAYNTATATSTNQLGLTAQVLTNPALTAAVIGSV